MWKVGKVFSTYSSLIIYLASECVGQHSLPAYMGGKSRCNPCFVWTSYLMSIDIVFATLRRRSENTKIQQKNSEVTSHMLYGLRNENKGSGAHPEHPARNCYNIICYNNIGTSYGGLQITYIGCGRMPLTTSICAIFRSYIHLSNNQSDSCEFPAQTWSYGIWLVSHHFRVRKYRSSRICFMSC